MQTRSRRKGGSPRARAVGLVTGLGWTVVACSPNLYVLPEPPPEETWETVSLDPTVEDRQAGERYLEARRAVLALVDALSGERWSDAWELLSNETRLLLDSGSEGRGEDSLAQGRIVRDGAAWRYDPLDLFLIRDLERIEDSMEGEVESETTRRHEVFVVNSDGAYRKVVLIQEGSRWLVHLPRWPQDRLVLEAPSP